jgi:hypothetical protein
MATDTFRPALAFRVGVTGHRDLDEKTCDDLRPRVHAKLEQIKRLVEQVASESKEIYDNHAAVILRAISPLAEGADRLFAEEALTLQYQLEAPLPFDYHEYRNDFQTVASKRRFDELLKKAGAVFELDGSRQDAPAAYATLGSLVLDQCDILIAVWDGQAAKGAGGTAEVVARARLRGIPVLCLHPHSHDRDTIYADATEDAGRVTSDRLDAALKDTVWQLLLPSGTLGPPGSLNSTERLLAPLLVWVWRTFERIITVGVKRRPARSAGAPPPSVALDSFQRQFALWDTAANLLAGLYRGAFLLNYTLGVLAVFLALLGNAFGGLYWLPICESIAILIVISLVSLLRERRWHLRIADCRYLAEQFRILCYSYPLGLAPRTPHLPAHYLPAGFRDSWVEWHARAIVRQTPMPTATVTPAYVEEHCKAIRKWIRGQIEYHKRNAAKLEKIEHRLYFLCWLSIAFALVAALLAWICHGFVEEYGLERWLLFLTAGLPAASAAAHAVSTQGEFNRLVERSESMTERLRSSLGGLHHEGQPMATLRRQTDELAQVLMDEVADWQILYRKPAPPPG